MLVIYTNPTFAQNQKILIEQSIELPSSKYGGYFQVFYISEASPGVFYTQEEFFKVNVPLFCEITISREIAVLEAGVFDITNSGQKKPNTFSKSWGRGYSNEVSERNYIRIGCQVTPKSPELNNPVTLKRMNNALEPKIRIFD